MTHLPGRSRFPYRRLLPALTAVSALVALSACGPSGGSGTPHVASLSGHSSQSQSAPGSATTDTTGRPQIRLDSTHAEVKRMLQGWYACLKQHGMNIKHGHRDETEADKAALNACLSKSPLPPPQMDRSKNPHYLDDYHAWITCMQGKGEAVQPIQPFGTGWNYDRSKRHLTDAQRHQIERTCKVEAFGDH